MNESSQVPTRDPNAPTPMQAAQPYLIAAAVAVGLIVFYPALAKTIAIFVVVLSVLVFVHEWGHYQFARWAGMKVNRFGIGFPPWIFNVRRNGIDYSIGALPIGGMVDIAGLGSEEDMVQTGREAVGTAGTTVSGVEQESMRHESRMDSYRDRNPNAPHGEKRFQDAPLGWRFMTLFAGPMMNFILAIVIFVGMFSIAGLPNYSYKSRVNTLVAEAPAAKAGLEEGDTIAAIRPGALANPPAATKPKSLPTPDEVAKLIRGSKGQPVTMTLERRGETIQKEVKPELRDVDNDGKKEYSIGISFDLEAIKAVSYTKVTPAEAVKIGFLQSVGTGMNLLDTIRRAVIGQLTREEVKQIGGPVKIAHTTGKVSQYGFWSVMFLAGNLSVNLGIMNLLPLPALDGGRISFLGYEFIMRRPIDPRKEGLVHMAGMILLLTFMVLITFKDVIGLRG